MTFLVMSLLELLIQAVTGIMDFFAKDFFQGIMIPQSTGEYFSADGKGWFDGWLPGVSALKDTFRYLGLTFATLLFILGLLRAMVPDADSKADHPFTLIARFGVASFCTYNAYLILTLIQAPMSVICKYIKDLPSSNGKGPLTTSIKTGDEGPFGLLANTFVGDGTVASTTRTVHHAGRAYHTSPGVSSSVSIDTLPLTVLAFLIILVLAWAYLKLILEMIERFVTLGFLFYVAPLPFGMLSTSGTSGIFKSYMQMLFSEYLLVMFNMLFLYVFLGAFGKINGAGMTMDTNLIFFLAVMLAWLKLGARLDEMLQAAGVSAARTGYGLGGEILAGMGLAAALGKTGVRSAKTASKMGAAGATAIKSWTTPNAPQNLRGADGSPLSRNAQKFKEGKLGGENNADARRKAAEEITGMDLRGKDVSNMDKNGNFSVTEPTHVDPNTGETTGGQVSTFTPTETFDRDMQGVNLGNGYTMGITQENMDSHTVRQAMNESGVMDSLHQPGRDGKAPKAVENYSSQNGGIGMYGVDDGKGNTTVYADASVYNAPSGAEKTRVAGREMWKITQSNKTAAQGHSGVANDLKKRFESNIKTSYTPAGKPMDKFR